MGGYFHGLRRKLGVVTLVMACMFAVGWVRSFNFGDFARWNCACISENGNLYINPPDPLAMSWQWPEWSITNVVAAEEESTLNAVTWKWRFMGFGDGEFSIFGANFRVILFPYWSIVIPLTLLSAYLFLSKTRTKIRKKLDQPIPAGASVNHGLS